MAKQDGRKPLFVKLRRISSLLIPSKVRNIPTLWLLINAVPMVHSICE
ncbi:unnamed protein product [Strongylus vulgaris]|uniref:Uncharacterized protein n=1 Tax=Strongylus vulgaris TaxID=40348 RepID=A0A3P7KFI2_STRVU|nr:unnamed protein product [Strongylus vulgaris]